MTNVYFNLIQREEMARNLWVYLCTHQGVKSAKSMSAGSEAEGRKTEGRASNEHPLSIHSASIQHPLQSGGNKVKTSLRFLRYVAMIFAVLVLSIGNAWGAVGTSASTTFTCGTTSTSGVTYAYTFNSNAANSDTIVFNAYLLYNSSVTYAYKSGSPSSGQADFKPLIYNSASGQNLTSAKGIYSSSSSNPYQLRVQSGKILYIKVTNCIGVMLSGNSGGNSRTTNLDVYLGTNLDTPIDGGSKTIGYADNVVEVTGMSSSNTYVIKISGSTTSNCTAYELALVYPHAGGGGSSYSITYHCNDATSGCPATNPATEQTALPSPLPTVTKTNYTFGGWYTDAAYSSAASAGASLSDDADLYAKWTQTITLDREGASTGSTSVTATYNSATLPSITNPTKDGFVFEGWYDGDNGTGNLVINTSGALQANVSGYTGADGIWTSATARTLYAKWTEAPCFSATINKNSSSYSVSGNSSKDITSDATVTSGGAVSCVNYNASSKSFNFSANGVSPATSDGYVQFTLPSGSALTTGSVIRVQGYADNADGGLLLIDDAGTTVASQKNNGVLDFSYTVTAGSAINGLDHIRLKRARTSGTNAVKTVTVTGCGAPSCTAPNHVDVTGRWDRFAGETISLTATAYSSAGTGSPIAAANITGYQWEKLVGTTWTALSNGTTDGVTTSGATTANLQIANCKATNSGKYRCVVSTGATCSTASATATDGTQGLGVKVFMLECYNDGTKTCSFTRTGDTQTGTATLTLAANTAYTFKFHVDNVYYGNNASINEDITNYVFCNSDNGGNCASNFTINSGLGGTFTLGIDYSTGGNSNVEGEPELSVTYPRKTIYLTPGVWNSGSAKFAFYYFRSGGSSGWTDFLTANDCGMSAEIPQWNGVKVNAVRLKNTCTSPNWDDKWNQTSDITISSNNSVVITEWGSGDSPYTYGTYATPTYTISYNAGTGGSGTKDDESKTCGVDFTLPGSTFTYAGHTQDGWATADGGAIAYALSGSYTTNDDEEFFPHWKCNTPTITDNGDNTVTITVPAGTTVRYTTDGTNPTSSTGTVYSSAFTIDATVTVKAIAYQSNCTDSEVASQACTYHAAVTCTGDPTALVSGTLYKAQDMKSACFNTVDGDFVYGLSANDKFYITGTTNGDNSSTGTVEIKGQSKTIDAIAFDSIAWLKGSGSTTHRSIKFVTGGAGTLTVYGRTGKNAGNVQVKPSASSAVNVITASSSSQDISGTYDVTAAGTYYILSNGNSAAVYGIKFVAAPSCTTPAAPTGFSAGSITSTGATFSITDAGDAASYDIYYSTSSTAPTASTPATTTSTSKTKAVTGLTASTTYYAWVRSVCDADHKSAWVAGTSFTTSAGGGCTPQSVVKTVLSSTTAGTTTGYNNDEYAGSATIVTFQGTPIDGGYKMQSGSKLFVTLKKGNFVEGDKINIVITKASDLPNTTGKLPIFYNASSPALLTTIDAASAGTYTYTLTASDITTLGSNKTIGVFRSSSTTENNPYVKSVEVEGCRDWTVDETAPTFVSSVPANGATDVATSGTIVLTFSEPLGNVDASKFTLTGATKGAVAIDGSDATKVNIAYSGAENSSTVTLATAAAAVSDVAGNALAAALSNISFTTAAAAPAGDCITIAYFDASQGSSSSNKPDNAGKYLYGYTNSAKTEAYAYTITTGSTNNKGQGTGASDYLRMDYGTTVNIYADNTTTGGTPATFSNVTSVSVDFKMNKSSYYTTFDIFVGSTKIADNVSLEGAAQSAFTTFTYNNLEQLNGKISIVNKGSGSTSFNFHIDNIQICTSSLPACTTPVLPTLTAKTVCEGGDADAAWNAAITNSGSLVSGETVAYSWVKKGGSTPVSSVATYQPTDVTEAMAGTYVVTATVSADGKASKSATKEVELTVNEATEVTAITADKATVYPTNSVTLTATASATATWQWYTCTNAEGEGEDIISGAESASYTIASAGAAGTYYYKAVATGDCGIGSMVYTLTVSAAAGGDCFHFVSVLPAGDITVSSNTSLVTPTHATTLEGGTMKVGSSQMTIAKDYGLKLENSKYVTVTLESALEAGNVVIVKGTSGTKGYGITINGVNFYDADNKTFDVSYTVLADDGLVGKTALTVTKYSGSSYLQEIKITGCGEACTDPEVTASVNNSTACVGSSVTFTAAGAHAEASYQWQKYSGGAWTNIDDATASTYNIASVATTDAMKYRVIANNDCDRTSNEVTLSVPVAPVFDSFSATRTVMATQALSITDVEASDATAYAWYKSADATYDAGTDTKVGTTQELLLASGGEAAGATYYLFCVASNACGSTTSSAITVNVTAFIEEDCATRGTEGAAEFGFQNSGCGQGSYQSANCYTMNSNSKILVYSAPDGKYFKTMKVTIASSSASKASYNWSTDGGSSYTADGVAITGVTTTLTEKTIDLSAHGNVNEVKIGRNFGNGESSGTLYVSKICFEYTESCTATTVTPSTSSVNYEMGGAWSNPTFTLSVAGTLTYSSSNEDIASVDDDGTVTFNGEAGTVTITASYAGGTISATEYCASSGSYIINVSCPGGAPKVVADGSVNMSGCNSSVILNAKTQAGADFADGTYQWFRNGEEIDGATSSSYTATQAGTYTVERTNTSGCTTPSTNSAVVTSETTEPEVERLVPFHYYHVDKTYTAQMKDRHLFSVKGSAAYGSTGKNFKLTMSRNGEAETDMTTAASIWVKRSDDGQVDTVMIDLNKLSGKYSEGDELVLTCAAVDCSGNVSAVYKDEITINVIGATPTLALICSGSNKASGTRKTSELTVGGDFLTGYNVADLCQQTGNTSFDANTEWGLYTRLKENYIVTPVNGYAVFNKLNYEPFDILLLTDYPKASKSDAAATVLDDMADLCDYRPMLSFKAHMVAKSPSKWAAKGFTTSPVVPKNTRTRLNIVCYAHPMFADMKTTATHIQKDNDDPSQIVYTMLTGAGYEGSKGLQGFELEAAENFVTIGLVHYNATPADGTPSAGLVTWTPGSEDRMLVTAVERQENLEARMIMFAVNCGAQSKFTETGRNVVLKCLEYLLDDDPLHVADCSFTFDNGAGNSMTAAQQAEACESCTGTKGDGKWSTAANWGPDYVVRPGKDTEVKIAAPVIVDPAVGAGAATNFTPKVRSVRILEGGKVEIPAGSYLEVVSTIRRQDGNDIYPTEVEDLHIGSSTTGNGTLIFNNSTEDTKAQVDMYSKGFIDYSDPENEPKGVKNYQYIGTPFVEVNALYNYYGSWIYYWKADGSGWKAVKNGGPMTAWTGYCITQEEPTYHQMSGTLTATGTVDINVPADANMVVGNSWTAPIDINALTTDDLEGLTASIYFFNTGVDKKGEGTTTANATGDARWAGGTYVSVPIHSAPYTGDDHIPSLQGFFVKNTGGSAGTLHLDYDKHVRGSSRAGRLSEEMHAPARRIALSSDEPTVLKIKVSGENYDDKLLLLEREDFTEGFDNGWDGDKWDGNESALYIYTTDNEGTENSVSAVPELEGTVIGFRAGEEDDAYTLNFEYLNSDEPLYLYDSENSTYTRIMTGVTYRFFTTDKSKHARFIITRKNPQVATGVGNVSDDGLRSSKVKKLLLDNKLFILRNGMLYDATGKVVK